jgi:hypothetical protein
MTHRDDRNLRTNQPAGKTIPKQDLSHARNVSFEHYTYFEQGSDPEVDFLDRNIRARNILETFLNLKVDKTALRLEVKKLEGFLRLTPKVGTHEYGQDVFELEDQTYSQTRQILAQLLTQACDVARCSVEKRAALVPQIIDVLLNQNQDPQLWTEKVQKTRPTPPPHLPLPEKATATWQSDKQPGDTPPDFIKRHYTPWLRADGLGLTRADIRRLDEPLYTGLANWLRKNKLPEDCPIPKLSEQIDRELQLPVEDFEVKDLLRLAQAKKRRQI